MNNSVFWERAPMAPMAPMAQPIRQLTLRPAPRDTTAQADRYKPGYPPENAVDRDTITSWQAGNHVATLDVSFPSPFEFSAVQFIVDSMAPSVQYYTLIGRDASGREEILCHQLERRVDGSWGQRLLPIEVRQNKYVKLRIQIVDWGNPLEIVEILFDEPRYM